MKLMMSAVVLVLGFLAWPAIAANDAAASSPAVVVNDAAASSPAISSPARRDQPSEYVTQKEYFDLLRVVLDTSKENNEHLKTVITVGAWLLALIVALFAFFGYRELQAFLNPLKEKLNKLETDYGEKSASLSKALEGKIHGDIQAVIKTGYALNLIEMTRRDATHPMSAEDKKSLFMQALSHLDKALNKDSPEDHTLIAWIQGHRSYVLKRLDRLPEAYEAATSAYSSKKALNENGGTPAFNAACYACLQGKTEDALKWLGIAITEDGHNIRDAWEDEDFSSLRSDAQFKMLVRQGR